jgi:hypothetical protein
MKTTFYVSIFPEVLDHSYCWRSLMFQFSLALLSVLLLMQFLLLLVSLEFFLWLESLPLRPAIPTAVNDIPSAAGISDVAGVLLLLVSLLLLASCCCWLPSYTVVNFLATCYLCFHKL